MRFAPRTYRTLPARKRTLLASVEPGRIVLYHDRWAVVESDGWNGDWRILDYWDGPAERVRSNVVVTEVLASKAAPQYKEEVRV